ncbi:ABC transporter substrate-binding protein [Streptomyces brasiliensis]|uniref:ABC transporter substrate-binding protein n=1 Tax=Streptomyces brasiliensis TaxID=1954 RepID=UPI001670372A|nr:ABC transporter substrate-binding protein [Streptomyces brasiliensis]
MKLNMIRRRAGARTGVLAAGAALSLLALSACGGASSGSASDAFTVGMVVSKTGPLSTYSADWENGFRAGLDYLTQGKMEIDGKPIKLIEGDDTGDATVGSNVATNLLSDGAQVLVGPTSSPVALAVANLAIQNNVLFVAGDAGTTDLVGMDDRVFAPFGAARSGNEIDAKIVGDVDGKTVATIDPDYEFGQTQAAGVKAVLEPLGATVKSFLEPTDTADFTTVAQKVAKPHPDFVTTSWLAPGQLQLYRALAAQGVFKESHLYAALMKSDSFKTIAESLGNFVNDTRFSIAYFPGATGNEQDLALQKYGKAHKHTVEYDDSMGWTAAEIVYHALTNGDASDGESLAKTVKDWSFTGPQGEVQIRGKDNQIILPRFSVKLTKQNGQWGPKLVKAVPASELVPPVVKAIGQ